jgi:hypothetical protein
MRHVFVFVAVTLLCLMRTNPHAQPQSWLDRHAFENRWEGLVTQPNNSPAYELRGFMAYTSPLAEQAKWPAAVSAWSDRTKLWMHFFVGDTARAYVDVRELQSDRQYLMRPKPAALPVTAGWRTFGPWPLNDVIWPSRIPQENLGIVIRVGSRSEANTRLAPALLQAESSARPSIHGYALYMYFARAVAQFEFEVAGPDKYFRTYPVRPSRGGDIVKMPFAADDLPKGDVTVRFNPRYADSPTERPGPFAFEFRHER